MSPVEKKRGLRGFRLSLSLAVLSFTAPAIALAQDSLPFPPTPSGSKAARTMQQSTYAPIPARRRLPADAPNILIIMLDDAGFALPSTYGGDVNTPTLSRIAATGISYNRFHNAAMCSPTRAALLTGRNHHRVGNGQIAEFANDWDGYRGLIPRTAATVANVLGDYGYSTSAFGKWHNTPANETIDHRTLYELAGRSGHRLRLFLRLPRRRVVAVRTGDGRKHRAAEPGPRSQGLSRHRRHDGQGGVVDSPAACVGAGPSVPHVLGARRGARPAPGRQEVGGQIQGQVQRGLGRHARARVRAPETTGLDPRQHRADAAAVDDPGVERHSRQREGVSASLDGSVRRLRRAHRHAGRPAHRRARRTRHPREHARLLCLERQRCERGGPERHDQRTAGAERRSVDDQRSHQDDERARRPRRVGRPQGRQHVSRGLGVGHVDAAQGDEARRGILRRDAHADGGVVAEGDQARQDPAPAIPPRQRHRADDL